MRASGECNGDSARLKVSGVAERGGTLFADAVLKTLSKNRIMKSAVGCWGGRTTREKADSERGSCCDGDLEFGDGTKRAGGMLTLGCGMGTRQ